MPVIHEGSGGLAKAIVGSRTSTARIGKRAATPRAWEEGGLADRIGCCRHNSERIPRLSSSSEQKRNVQRTFIKPPVTVQQKATDVESPYRPQHIVLRREESSPSRSRRSTGTCPYT